MYTVTLILLVLGVIVEALSAIGTIQLEPEQKWKAKLVFCATVVAQLFAYFTTTE